MPLFFIDTLNMDRVSSKMLNLHLKCLNVSCNMYMQASIAKGPLILLITSLLATFLLTMKCIRRICGDKVIAYTMATVQCFLGPY